MEANGDLFFKVVLVGESGAGKTSIVLRYTDNTFSEEPLTSIGSDFKVKDLVVDGRPVKLQIWDTAGQERFASVTASFYRASHGALLVFDAGDAESFNNVARWNEELKRYAPDTVCRVVVANKVDISTATLDEKGMQTLKDMGVTWVRTSAKTGEGIEEALTTLAREMLKKHTPSAPSGTLRAEKKKGKKEGGKCALL
eukprot:m51a1_g1615 putative ras-related protein rab-1a (198) ;mRNA; f:213530-214964